MKKEYIDKVGHSLPPKKESSTGKCNRDGTEYRKVIHSIMKNTFTNEHAHKDHQEHGFMYLSRNSLDNLTHKAVNISTTNEVDVEQDDDKIIEKEDRKYVDDNPYKSTERHGFMYITRKARGLNNSITSKQMNPPKINFHKDKIKKQNRMNKNTIIDKIKRKKLCTIYENHDELHFNSNVNHTIDNDPKMKMVKKNKQSHKQNIQKQNESQIVDEIEHKQVSSICEHQNELYSKSDVNNQDDNNYEDEIEKFEEKEECEEINKFEEKEKCEEINKSHNIQNIKNKMIVKL